MKKILIVFMVVLILIVSSVNTLAADIGQTSDDGPDTAVFNGNTYITWIGSGNKQINVMPTTNGSFDASKKVTFPEKSNFKPAITVYKDCIYVAWTGTDGVIHMKYSTDGKYFYPAALKNYGNGNYTFKNSIGGPSLITTNYGHMMTVAWTGTDNRLNIMDMSCEYLSPNYVVCYGTTTLEERSLYGCSLTEGYELCLSWIGLDGRLNCRIASNDRFVDSTMYKAIKKTFSVYSNVAPSCIFKDNYAVLAYTGTNGKVSTVWIDIYTGKASTPYEYGRYTNCSPCLDGSLGYLRTFYTNTDGQIISANVTKNF